MVVRDKNLYKSFCEIHSQTLPLFYSTKWLDTVCENQWDALLYKRGEEIIAALPYHRRKKYGLSAIIGPVLTPYCGEWYIDSVIESEKANIQHELIKALPKVFYYNLGLHHTNKELTAYTSNNFKVKTRYTHIIKNKTFQQAYDAFESTTKAHIRKAEKSLQIVKNNDTDALWVNLNQTYQRSKIKVAFNKSMIEKICGNFKGKVNVYHAVDEYNTAHASVLTIEDNHTVYHLLSGRNDDAIRGANALIVYHTVKDTMEKGKNYDFEGSSIPSIATFFRSFGSEVVTFNQVYKSRYRFTDVILKMMGKF